MQKRPSKFTWAFYLRCLVIARHEAILKRSVKVTIGVGLLRIPQ